MSKKAYKLQASSARAASGAFGGAFGQGDGAFGSVAPSPLSYVYEPPALTGIADPNVIVALKNLQKKDGTTKNKALEELQNYVGSLEKKGIDEGILEAWVKVYPRTSIDSSRRVRQLAHSLQGQIAISCGKRLAKHMPAIVPSWLAGLHDPDKAVSRAAQESFRQVFATEEKATNVWRVYHQAIVEYTGDVVAKETENTLSDERTTSPDDAAAKYARVIGCAATALTTLLKLLTQTDLEKSYPIFVALTNEKMLWKLANHADAFVRRAIYRLLIVCLGEWTQILNASMLSEYVLTMGLHTNQVGSSLDYVKAVVQLSEGLPTVWTSDYQGMGKKSAYNRLLHFLRKGSQGGPAEFWTHVSRLLSIVPTDILFAQSSMVHPEPASSESDVLSLPMLEALREGATNKDESRASTASAWNAYLRVCDFILSTGKVLNESRFLQSYLLPLIYQYTKTTPDLSQWTLTGSQQQDICARACHIVLSRSLDLFEREWHFISSKIVEDFQTSLPEQSKDYTKSQDSVAAEALRWYRLQAALVERSTSESAMQTISQEVVHEIAAAISVLKARNGKPYGLAAALQTAVQLVPTLIFSQGQAKDPLVEFVDNHIPCLMTSPSAPYLIRLLDIMEDSMDIRSAYLSCIQTLEEMQESPAKQTALRTLLSSPGLAKAGLLSTTANRSLARAIDQAVKENDDSNWSLLTAALVNVAAPKDLTDDVLTIMTEGLSIETNTHASLHGLELTTKQNKTAIRDFAAQSKGSSLMSKLLFLSDAPDLAISQKAKELMTEIEDALSTAGNITQNTRPLFKAIQREFEVAGPESLSIESLVRQADRLLKQTLHADLPSTVLNLIPKPAHWNVALAPFTTRLPNPSLAVTNVLGAATAIVRSDQSKVSKANTSFVSRDQDGRSVLLRILQYVTRVVQVTELLSQATEDQKLTLLQYVTLTIQLAGDNISVSGSMPLWITDDADVEAEISESIFEAQGLLAQWILAAPMSALVPCVQKQLLKDSEGFLTSAYYHARAYLTINDELAESKGQMAIANAADGIKAIRKSPNIFTNMVLLISCDRKDAIKCCNEYLTDLTIQKFDMEDAEGQQEALRTLLFLNCLLRRPDELLHDIPQQRLIFYVQHVVSGLKAMAFDPAMEIVRSLTAVLPAIKEIYGSFWGVALDLTKSVRQYPLDDMHLPGHHACLRLCATLTKPHMLEANDDLVDAWMDRKQLIMKGLVKILEEIMHIPDESHLPRRIFNDLLSRLLANSSQVLEGEEENLYPVLASESATLQRIAYELLHEQIPSKQEHLSLDKALTKGYEAKLPEELLSLVLAPPSLSTLSASYAYRIMPISLRSYLLSWTLVFDHWKNASSVLQADYAKSLGEGTYLRDLLDLSFNILINARGKPVDASKFDIQSYAIDIEPPEKDMHWLLSYLYFLCLKYLPIQSKTWWRDTTSRQTNIAVEAWTQKYVSKHVIATELDSIREWAPTQGTGDQPLTIKVSTSTCEITASIPVDEQSMVLAIRLPPSYPLSRAEVEGVRRVGVPEKKWASWIRNTQGQLTIASEGGANALIDCLLAWRKNVTATLKGQSECAICYSVVGADRTLPSKVCKTCKNKFHGSCLFRWFSSSNSSSCPLCRNTFTYS